MGHQPRFKAKARHRPRRPHLRDALGQSRRAVNGRGALVARLPEFEQLRDQARDVRTTCWPTSITTSNA